MWFRLGVQVVEANAVVDLRARLRGYDARIRIEDGSLIVAMRVVGHLGPASAIGEASQMLRHHAAAAGLLDVEVDVVHAQRFAATAGIRD